MGPDKGAYTQAETPTALGYVTQTQEEPSPLSHHT